MSSRRRHQERRPTVSRAIAATILFVGGRRVEAVSSLYFTKIQAPSGYAVTRHRSIPHEGRPWTQGLEMSPEGFLIETSGAYPSGTESFVRVIDPQTGRTLRKTSAGLKAPVFVEGIAQLGNTWFASTWLDRKVLEFDDRLELLGTHPYPCEGWGLVRNTDGKSFLATNGSEHLIRIEPGTFNVLGAKPITCFGQKVTGMNELEFVADFGGHGPAVLGNIMNTRLVLAVDPESAVCKGVFHLDGLEQAEQGEAGGLHVANGVAYDSRAGTFWVTGKNWAEMFEISIAEDAVAGEQAVEKLRTYLQGSFLR